MKLTFLGGADEVGASCMMVEISGHRLVVDCGVRMSGPGPECLPDLGLIEAAGDVEAIILTHAHLDHVGALPVLAPRFPHAPIYMTPATLQLATVMLNDALKVMAIQQQEHGVGPIYGAEGVEAVIGAARCVPFGHTISLFDGDVRMQFLPAGHILGAATVILEGTDGTLFLTGDISCTDQITIPGMMVPERLRPDLVVIESTYGGRHHASRDGEESRIVEQVRTVVERGGAVLFPAFAVGRAQEVILILARAIERGELPEGVPIYVDGLVRQICKVYTAQESILTPWMRDRIARTGNPFFSEGGPVVPLWNPKDRPKAAEVRPAIFVASSGMLTGGPSQLYARALAKDPKSFIAITGYQDEESPGRRLQELAREGRGSLTIGGEQVELRCGVGTYGLSAHADTAQMVAVLSELKPRKVALVHGDGGARKALSDAVERARAGAVYRPASGDTIEIEGRPGRSLQRVRRDVVRERPLTVEELPRLAQSLIRRDGAGQSYTCQDILWAWGDVEAGLDADAISLARTVIESETSPFKRDKKRPFIYRIRTSVGGVVKLGGKKGSKQNKAMRRASQQDLDAVLARVSEVFPPETGLYKRKVKRPSQTIVLSFPFPKIAQAEHEATLATLGEATGWTFLIRDTPHQQALIEAAVALMPSGFEVIGTPAVHVDRGLVEVKVRGLPDGSDALCARYLEETGFEMGFKVASPQASAQASTPKSAAIGVTEAGAWELNKAFAAIKARFAGLEHEPIKVSKKGAGIEVAFISPEIGARYGAVLGGLAEETGWAVSVRDSPDQHRIKELAKALLPEGTEAAKEPGVRVDKREVTMKLARPLPKDEARHLVLDFEEACGYRLVLKP